MGWTYKQKTGELQYNGFNIAVGYSGAGDGKDNPDMQEVRMVGPIPRGQWVIHRADNLGTMGKVVMQLTPATPEQTCYRSGFFIHGDKVGEPGAASHGCIILPRAVRELIDSSSDRLLEVVHG